MKKRIYKNIKVKDLEMIVFIPVMNAFDAKVVGTLEIYTENSAYEFIGNGASDGGTFEFLMGSSKVECHLTSNIRKTKVATLFSASWGNVSPPTHPWKINTRGNGWYFGANGVEKSIEWIVNKST